MTINIPLELIECNLDITPELQVDIDKIAYSIQEQGLFHPITVHSLNTSDYSTVSESTELGKVEIIAGRKRFLAARKIGLKSILAEVKHGLDDYQKEEISLHENLKRAQLPWHEEVLLVKKLHELRQRQHGVPQPNRPASGEKKGWGVRDTADELGKALGGVSTDLQLARMVQQNPSLKNIKDKATATKVIKQTAQRIFQEEFAVVSGDVPFSNEVYYGESASLLEQFPDGSFDFSIQDPPWFKFAKSEDPSLKRDEFTLPVYKALFPKMKWDSVMYIFVGAEDFEFYKVELPKIGWKVQQHPCIWHKKNFLSRTGVRSWEHGRDLELILVAAKGSPVIASSTQVSSIFSHAVVPSKLLIHPNEKPTELIEEILMYCSYEGSLGIDPFAGSGVFGEACRKKKRNYVMVERDHDRYKKILDRMGRKK